MNKRWPAQDGLDLCLFLIGAFGTHLMQSIDRPITAVLVFLTSVITIAVHSGLRNALIAAIGASFVYNFFLSEPVLEFGVTTADEAVPLIAFNICALITGVLVGRLKDAAYHAEVAQDDTAFLLDISDRLQRALKVEQIEGKVRGVLPAHGIENIEIFLTEDDHLIRPSTGEIETDKLRPLVDWDDAGDGWGGPMIVELIGAQGPLGLVKFRVSREATAKHEPSNLRSISALLALAIDRCLLLNQLGEAQAAARSEELKDTILSSVSHDLRTPLTAIETAASALTSPQVSLSEADRTRLLCSILEQCRRLDQYTTELLDLSLIRAGISPSEFEIVDLTEITLRATNHARSAYPSVEIRRELAKEPVFVTANATMLEQAIFNVVENACKFGGEFGPVRVNLKHEYDELHLSVTDLGPGISETDRERLFERFFRGRSTNSRNGSGLGLFIAKGFLEAFSGRITVESQTDAVLGARFHIVLPAASQPAPMDNVT